MVLPISAFVDWFFSVSLIVDFGYVLMARFVDFRYFLFIRWLAFISSIIVCWCSLCFAYVFIDGRYCFIDVLLSFVICYCVLSTFISFDCFFLFLFFFMCLLICVEFRSFYGCFYWFSLSVHWFVVDFRYFLLTRYSFLFCVLVFVSSLDFLLTRDLFIVCLPISVIGVLTGLFDFHCVLIDVWLAYTVFMVCFAELRYCFIVCSAIFVICYWCFVGFRYYLLFFLLIPVLLCFSWFSSCLLVGGCWCSICLLVVLLMFVFV